MALPHSKYVRAITLPDYPIFYKALFDDWTGMHGSYSFHLGLNEDNQEFHVGDVAVGGGIYFTNLKHLPDWASPTDRHYIAVLTLEPDEMVWCDGREGVFKAHSIFIDRIYEIKELANDPEFHVLIEKCFPKT
jgi:hypothetical protein